MSILQMLTGQTDGAAVLTVHLSVDNGLLELYLDLRHEGTLTTTLDGQFELCLIRDVCRGSIPLWCVSEFKPSRHYTAFYNYAFPSPIDSNILMLRPLCRSGYRWRQTLSQSLCQTGHGGDDSSSQILIPFSSYIAVSSFTPRKTRQLTAMSSYLVVLSTRQQFK